MSFSLRLKEQRERMGLSQAALAKELNVSVTDIMSQNSELSLPLNDGEKIVVYRQLHTDEN